MKVAGEKKMPEMPIPVGPGVPPKLTFVPETAEEVRKKAEGYQAWLEWAHKQSECLEWHR